jgi:hypothetical protein
MSESVRIGKDVSPDHTRYRVLLEIIDIVSRAPSLPEAFEEFAQPWLDASQGEFLNLSVHDRRRNCMLSQYWKRNQESGELKAFPLDEEAPGWAWKNQEPLTIPGATTFPS